MKILAIETSCDETAAALVEDGKKIISNKVFSQVDIHKKFNGIVPEVASRNHLLKIIEILDETLNNFNIKEIDGIAVTNGPGLIGSLLVGLSVAKSISFALRKPLVPVNHIYAHLYSPHLFYDIEFPYIGLVLSGGHTLIYKCYSFYQYELLGTTIDDAIGEAFDKVAKLLGLGYPGGPIIDKLAQNGDPDLLPEFKDMPKVLNDDSRDRYNFSYSGLKTAIAYRLNNFNLNEDNIKHIAASFQKVAIEIIIRKTRNAIYDTKIKRLVITGGVASNSYLRNNIKMFTNEGIEVFITPIEYCNDNAAMVAGRGYVDFIAGNIGNLRTEAFSRIPIIVKGKRKI